MYRHELAFVVIPLGYVLIAESAVTASRATPWQPLGYGARRTDTPIDIDGDIYKAAWAETPWSDDFGEIRGKNAPSSTGPTADTRTRVKMRWDDDYLYIAAEMTAINNAIVAEFTERNSPIFQKDSDFEVFLDTDESTHNYKEYEVNAIGTVWNLMLDKSYGDGGGEHSARVAKPGEEKYWDVRHQKSRAKMFGNLGEKNPEGKWTVEIALAHNDSLGKTSGSKPTFGKSWRINFSRVQNKGDINWVWSPQMQWDPEERKRVGAVNMHIPDVWGYVGFVEETSTLAGPGWSDPNWPLKDAANQLFVAEKHALSEEGGSKFMVFDELLQRGFISKDAFTSVSTTVSQRDGGAWDAELRQSNGCVATVQSDHYMTFSCSHRQ